MTRAAKARRSYSAKPDDMCLKELYKEGWDGGEGGTAEIRGG
jgi:hypothetical protein